MQSKSVRLCLVYIHFQPRSKYDLFPKIDKKQLNFSNTIFPIKYSSWWRRIEGVFRLRLQKTSSRGLQDVLIKTNIFALAIHLQKMSSSRRLGQDQYIRLEHTSWRRLQDVLKKRLQGIFKRSPRRFEDVFRTSSRHLQDVLPRRLQYVFKMSCKNVFKISARCLQEVLKTFSRRLGKISSRRFQDISSS